MGVPQGEEHLTDLFTGIAGRNTSDYVMRTAQQHHVALSQMADIKANIIITTSSIVLTLALSRVRDPALQTSLLLLASFTLLALFLAIIAVLPKFRTLSLHGDALPPGFNVMFFGHFAALSKERFYREMADSLRTDARVYHTLANDLYGLGIYLRNHKYRYLRYSYVAFLAGFIAACLAQMWRYASA